MIRYNTAIIETGSIGLLDIFGAFSSKIISGTLTTAVQPNVTQVGTLQLLNTSGPASFSGGVVNTGNNPYYVVNATVGNPGIQFQSSSIEKWRIDLFNTDGHLRFLYNVATEVLALKSTGATIVGNLDGISTLTATTVSGTLATPAQPNVTSLGTVLGLNLNGDLTFALSQTQYLVRLNSSVTAGAIRLRGDTTTNSDRGLKFGYTPSGSSFVSVIEIPTDSGDVIPTVDNFVPLGRTNQRYSNVYSVVGTFTNIGGTLITASQPNITALGTLATLNVSGTGSIAYVSASSLVGVLQTPAQPNVVSLGTLQALNVTGLISTATGYSGSVLTSSQPLITHIGTLDGLTVVGIVLATSMSVSSFTATSASFSSITVSTSSIENFSAQTGSFGILYATASISGTIIQANQPFITNVGTLSALSVNGFVDISKGFDDSTLRAEVVRISSTGRSATTGSNRSTLISFRDSANQTYLGAMGGFRESPPTNYNSGLVFYVNASSASPATTMDQLTKALFFSSACVATFSGSVIVPAGISGSLTQAAQENVTSLGTLTGLNVSGIISGSIISGSFIGSGVGVTGVISSSYAVSSSYALTSSYSSAGGSSLTATSASYSSNASTANTASYALFAGTVVTPAQSNITSLGTLTSLQTADGGAINIGTNASHAASNFLNIFGDNGAGLSSVRFYGFNAAPSELRAEIEGGKNGASGGNLKFYTANAAGTRTMQLLVDPTGLATFTAGVTATGFTGTIATFNDTGGSPLKLQNLSAPTDAKRWWAQVLVGDGQFRLRAINDAESTGTNAITITRAGNVASVLSLMPDGGTVSIFGATTFNAAVSGITTLTATTLNGTIGTAAQGSITSLGTLTGLTLGGTLTLNSQNIFFNEVGVRSWTMGVAASSGNLTLASGDGAGTLRIMQSLSVNGNASVVGDFTAATKAFLIKHPTKPGMMLRYGSLEGPENGVYVRGVLVDSDTIELPDYWKGLVDENTITVSFTPIGSFQKLYLKEIKDNKIKIGNSNLRKKINCHYIIYGERKDVQKFKVEYPA